MTIGRELSCATCVSGAVTGMVSCLPGLRSTEPSETPTTSARQTSTGHAGYGTAPNCLSRFRLMAMSHRMRRTEKKGQLEPHPGMPPPEATTGRHPGGHGTIPKTCWDAFRPSVGAADLRHRVEVLRSKKQLRRFARRQGGYPPFQIDPRTYQAWLRMRLLQTSPHQRQVFDRYKLLLEIKAVSQQEFDQAEARARRRLHPSKAQLDLENCCAPLAPTIAGRIGRALSHGRRPVGKGEATQLATIEQLDPVRVHRVHGRTTPTCCACSRPKLAASAGRQYNVELLLEDGSTYSERDACASPDLAVDPCQRCRGTACRVLNPRRELRRHVRAHPLSPGRNRPGDPACRSVPCRARPRDRS